MKPCVRKIMMVTATALLLPALCQAQGAGNEVYKLNDVLANLYEEMSPLYKDMVDVGRVIAGFAALWYIAIRVWKHIARAESIDFYPLLRPFAIGLAIGFFPFVMDIMNGVLKPVEVVTRDMSKDSHKAILYYLAEKDLQGKETPPLPVFPGIDPNSEKYEQPDAASADNTSGSGLGSVFSFFSITSLIKIFISEVTQTFYAAAALCINTIRTFYLIVLTILGPLILGLSVFDGFQHTLASWFARYINTYMWLPVANLFGAICSKILENMLVMDHDFAGSVAYIIFMIISIIGYTTVPNVAGYIIEAGGKDTLLHKVTSMTGKTASAAGKAIMGAF